MQYETLKKTKITLRSDRPTAIASSVYGANIDAIGFNISFIARRHPELAVAITDLLQEAAKLNEVPAKAAEVASPVALAAMHRVSGR